jgi:hypothetical protein
MTYMKPSRRYAPIKRTKPTGSLGAWWDDIIAKVEGGSPEGQCVDAANQALAPFDAKIDDIAKNWNPTGFYTSADIRNIVGQTLAVVRQSQAAVNAAAAEPNASQDSVMRASSDLGRKGQASLDYLQAANDADAQGLRVINAPGFKRWITDTLAVASSGMVTASVIGCITPWWVGALAAFQSVFDPLYALLKQFVGAVIAIGETALKVAAGLPEAADLILWGGLAVGAYYIWTVYLSRLHL